MIVAYRLEDDTETLRFYKYDYDEGKFVYVNFKNTKSYTRDFYIKNLIANDINNDGHIDLLLTIYNLWTKETTFEVHLFDPYSNQYKIVLSKQSTGIMLGDIDGDS